MPRGESEVGLDKIGCKEERRDALAGLFVKKNCVEGGSDVVTCSRTLADGNSVDEMADAADVDTCSTALTDGKSVDERGGVLVDDGTKVGEEDSRADGGVD